jgi:hypothetical protein
MSFTPSPSRVQVRATVCEVYANAMHPRGFVMIEAALPPQCSSVSGRINVREMPT